MKKIPLLTSLLLTLFFVSGNIVHAANQSVNVEKKKKVLIIGIDGMVPSALVTEYAPNLTQLMNESWASTNVLTDVPTWSMNGWSCILTGVSAAKHKLTINEQNPATSNIGSYPGLFKYLKYEYPEFKTASIVSWGTINDKINLERDLNIWYKSTSQDGGTYNRVMQELQNADGADIIFCHFDAVDHAGHSVGYSVQAPVYADSVKYIDRLSGDFLQAIKNRATYADEDWLVAVTTDHGGTFSDDGTKTSGGHGGSSYEERNTFIILNNPAVSPELISGKPAVIATDPITTVQFKENVYGALPAIDPAFLAADKNITIEMNIRASESESSDPCIFGNKDWDSGSNKGIALANQRGTLKVNIGGGGRTDIEGSESVDLEDYAWHFVSVVIDRTNQKMKLYHNGAFLSETSISASIGDLATNYGFFIAQDGTQNYNPFKGNITEIRFFKTALSAEVIAEYANKKLDNQHPAISDLLVYAPGTDGSGTKFAGALGSGDIELKTKSGATIEWKEVATKYITDYHGAPNSYDLIPTVFNFLNLPAKTEYSWDGKALIEFNNPVIPANPVPDPSDELSILDDFENGIVNYTFAFGIMGDVGLEVVENPVKDDVNSSQYVLKMTRTKANTEPWAGFFANPKAYAFERTIMNPYSYGRYKILRTVDGATANFKLENSAVGGTTQEIGPITAPSKVDQWEELVFDFKAKNMAGPYRTIVIMPDNAGNRPAETVVYIDDIAFSVNEVVAPSSNPQINSDKEKGLTVINSGNGEVAFCFSSETASTGTLEIYNISGQLVKKQVIAVNSGVNKEQLLFNKKGVFIVRINTGNVLYTLKFVI